jgi:hypothetical protein
MTNVVNSLRRRRFLNVIAPWVLVVITIGSILSPFLFSVEVLGSVRNPLIVILLVLFVVWTVLPGYLVDD